MAAHFRPIFQRTGPSPADIAALDIRLTAMTASATTAPGSVVTFSPDMAVEIEVDPTPLYQEGAVLGFRARARAGDAITVSFDLRAEVVSTHPIQPDFEWPPHVVEWFRAMLKPPIDASARQLAALFAQHHQVRGPAHASPQRGDWLGRVRSLLGRGRAQTGRGSGADGGPVRGREQSGDDGA